MECEMKAEYEDYLLEIQGQEPMSFQEYCRWVVMSVEFEIRSKLARSAK
jgi:hypothetical protein